MKNKNSEPLNVLKWQFLDLLKYLKLISRKNLSGKKFEFPTLWSKEQQLS